MKDSAMRKGLFACTLVMSATFAQTPDQFGHLVDRFFDQCYFRFSPTLGTSAGLHQYDRQLESYSRHSIEEEIAVLQRFETEFRDVHPKALDPEASADRDLVLSTIRAALLNTKEIRMWEKDPDRYSSGITNSIFVIMSRKFAPAADRIQSVIAREKQIPAVFADARKNLKNPPRIYTQIALEQLPGTIRFFQKDVPAAFAEVRDPELLAEFRSANEGAIQALRDYEQFLKADLLPRSNGDFRIGAANYVKKLEYEEMVTTPLEQLLERGYEDLRRNQAAFREAAARIDPKRAPQEVLHQTEQDHPAPEQLLQSFRDVLSGLRDFITQHKIVDIPSAVPPTLEETPPFMRALTFASMDTPGPFERVAKEAFFNVTLPEADWTPALVRQHMSLFNRGTIISTAIHEAYPGHYVQFLWVQRAPSKVRKLLGANTNAEGWAHYCEQMMLDEGYGNGDLKLRLGQIQDALLRNARYIVGISMHTGKMTFDQAVDFFIKEGYTSRVNGEREAKRGTSDPTYLVYTLGKLEILKLRDEYRRQKGAAFSLKEFHDRFLAQGYPPIDIVRRSMLH
jgi:uncharacterized protein (DUF885 family)